MAENSKIEWTDSTKWGNEVKRRDGYLIVHCPSYPGAKFNSGYVLKHRLVMAASLGRPLTDAEHVHHLNGNKLDNSPGNLQLMTNSEHRKLHEAMMTSQQKQERARNAAAAAALVLRVHRDYRMIPCECGCGEQIQSPDRKGRPKKFVQGHNQNGRRWKWGVGKKAAGRLLDGRTYDEFPSIGGGL